MAMAMKRVSPPKFQVKATTSWKSQAYSTLVALLYFLFYSILLYLQNFTGRLYKDNTTMNSRIGAKFGVSLFLPLFWDSNDQKDAENYVAIAKFCYYLI